MEVLQRYTKAYCKFRGRILLTRLGVWRQLERWRLMHRYKKGQPHEEDFRFFQHFDGSDRLFVDVGANIGQSALSFRLFNRTSPILSFEANTDLEWYLGHVKRRLGSGFDYRMQGLGPGPGETEMFVPVVGGVALSQEATLYRDELETDGYREYVYQITRQRHFEIARKTLRLVRFDDLGLNPGFVKIDVERAELEVLKGMENTIRRFRPLFMIEGHERVQDFMTKRDYRLFMYAADVDALVPFRHEPSFRNSFFVPVEQVELLERRGLVRV